jgi:hypothetical protein
MARVTIAPATWRLRLLKVRLSPWTVTRFVPGPEFDGYADSGNGPTARSSDGGGWLHIRLPKWSVLSFRQVG